MNVFLDHRRKTEFPCPECGVPLSVRDHKGQRRWRHVDSCGRLTWLHARVPRVHCLFHRVCQVSLPWALPHSHFTTTFESWAIKVLLETDVLGATRLLRVSWDEAWHLMERAVQRGQRRKQPLRSVHLGVDEKAIAKGHQYMTLVCDLDRGTVEYVAADRKQESLNEFYASRPANRILRSVVSCSRITYPGGLGHGTARRSAGPKQGTNLAAAPGAVATQWPDGS